MSPSVAWAVWLLPQYANEFPALSRVNWQAYAVFGISLALVLFGVNTGMRSLDCALLK